MNESPFEHTTLDAASSSAVSNFGDVSTPASGARGIEIRYPAAQRTIVPAALLLSAFIAPAIVFFFVQSPLNLIVAAALAVMEFSTAGFLWFLFNAAFVRADENGVTKGQLGQTKTVRWEEIGGMQTQQTTLTRPPRTEFLLKDLQGQTLLQFSDLSDRENGEKLAAYIAQRLEQRR